MVALLLTLTVGLIMNHRYPKANKGKSWVERCSMHKWESEAESGKLACIKCEFKP